MRTIIITLMLLFSISAYSQTFSAPKKQKVQYTDTTTTYKYDASDKVYDVFKSKSGAFYIWKVNKKTGKMYKCYLPKEVQKEMGRKYEE